MCPVARLAESALSTEIMLRKVLTPALLLALSSPCIHAQSVCTGAPLTGSVVDTTGAIIPGAELTTESGQHVTSGSDGRFRFPCMLAGKHRLHVSSPSFAALDLPLTAPHAELRIALQPDTVSTTIDVTAPAQQIDTDVNSTAGSQTISGERLTQLADDPDDLLRELQQLAAAAGGSPGNATISVDGFQDSSTLPPKSSIAYVKVNPDLFSSEYREPPWEGGRVEVYTKPGAKAFHGALFTTNSSQWMNARDPFSVSSAAIGKQRYGFELNGPVRKQGSNCSMTLEHRSIDDFAVINAVTFDPSGNDVNTVQNVPTPQRLWVATSRIDWQLGPKNIAFLSYSANVNTQRNVGVGGNTLLEAGYDSSNYEHTIRASNVTTISPKFVHEARLGISLNDEVDIPASNAPAVQVSGRFTGGGATIGNQNIHKIRFEYGDDVIITAKNHSIKAGLQFIAYDEHDRVPLNFNGLYIFQDAAHYRSNSPSQFENVAGDPHIGFVQLRPALYFQDDVKLHENLTFSFGLRYYLQNDPLVLNGATPRLGVAWSPDAKKRWTLHAHVGEFAGQYRTPVWQEVQREDGVHRVDSLVRNPVYNAPFSAGAVPVHEVRSFEHGFKNINYGMAEISVDRELPWGFHLSTQFAGIRLFNDARTLNINAPLNDNPNAPRPFGPNLNLLQTQNSGYGLGDVEFAGLSNFAHKRFGFFFGTVRVNIRDNTNDSALYQPQSAYTDAGEVARRSGNNLWQSFGNVNATLPYKLQITANYFGAGNGVFNIITGADNNGDGSFNDRPQIAAPDQAGAVSTPYGLLTSSGGIGVLRRNSGAMPWTFHLDSNIQRAWVVTRDKKSDHQQTLTANIRSSNVLNHTNVTSVGNVLGSPQFNIPYAADNGRRLEGGLRYSF